MVHSGEMTNQARGTKERQHPPQWPKAVVAAAVVLVAAFALIAYLDTGGAIRDAVSRGFGLGDKILETGPKIAEKFRTGKITLTFRESLPRFRESRGDVLEVAVFESDEIFQLTDERRIAWDLIYLGTTVAEIRVPATFRYHVRLSDDWRLETRGQVCLVSAPPLRPSLPPAIHTDRMEKFAENGWARFDKNEKLDQLERNLTPALAQRAADPDHLRLARERARYGVAEFVKNWLLREDHWRKDRFSAIVVVFADESEDLADAPPTMSIEK